MIKVGVLVGMGMFLCLLVAGCQYQLVAPLPESSAPLAIPMFVNRTPRVDLGETLTGVVIDEFFLRTSFDIVSREEADYVLMGEVVRYLCEPTTEVAAESTESRITIEVRGKLVPRSGYPIVWEENLTEYSIYSILEVGSTQTEQEAIQEVARKIGEDLVNLTLEGWKN